MSRTEKLTSQNSGMLFRNMEVNKRIHQGSKIITWGGESGCCFFFIMGLPQVFDYFELCVYTNGTCALSVLKRFWLQKCPEGRNLKDKHINTS